MPKSPPFARIAITLPEADLATADRLASEQDRPRSWVIAEAIRRYAATAPAQLTQDGATDLQQQYGLGPSRRAQLIADLRLTPEARVRQAEETARISYLRRPPLGKRVLAFDRYEDYVEWKRRDASGA